MNRYSLTFLRRNLPLFLAILCAQCIYAVIPANHFMHQSIEGYTEEKRVDQLLLLMQKRLVIMHEVARTKWVQNLPIEDRVREEQILVSLVQQARQYGLDDKWISKFFQAQMDAAKEIQKRDFTMWGEREIKFDSTFSLKDDLRLYIDQINQEMMEVLSKIFDKNSNVKFILDDPISKRPSDHIEEFIWQQAILPLKSS